MFGGLFKSSPSTPKPKRKQSQSQHAVPQRSQKPTQSDTRKHEKGKIKAETRKQIFQQQRDQTEQHVAEPATDQRDSVKRKRQKKAGSAVPQGGIPMNEEEIAAFEQFLEEKRSSTTAHRKRSHEELSGQTMPPQSATPATATLSRKARKKLRLQQREPDQQLEHPNKPTRVVEEVTPPLSKKARKRLRLQQRAHEQGNDRKPAATYSNVSLGTSTQLSSLRTRSVIGKAAARLQGSRFRWLNDTLYSITGAEAKQLYENDPTLANAYHEGFREQASKWPRNPLDDVIRWLKEEVPAEKVIGDFGCGDARLALELKDRKVHSFDLLKINERVTPCNLASVPMDDQSLDVAVFCLALMGTDWPSFLKEAHRCLRPGGTLHIAEVESRLSDMGAVKKLIEGMGFNSIFVKPGNFFIEMRFTRGRQPGRKDHNRGGKKQRSKADDGGGLLAGCTYRRR